MYSEYLMVEASNRTTIEVSILKLLVDVGKLQFFARFGFLQFQSTSVASVMTIYMRHELTRMSCSKHQRNKFGSRAAISAILGPARYAKHSDLVAASQGACSSCFAPRLRGSRWRLNSFLFRKGLRSAEQAVLRRPVECEHLDCGLSVA